MKKMMFCDVPVGKMFYFSIWDGISGKHRFMKVKDNFSGEANAVWMTKYRGMLCVFADADIVELEGE